MSDQTAPDRSKPLDDGADPDIRHSAASPVTLHLELCLDARPLLHHLEPVFERRCQAGRLQDRWAQIEPLSAREMEVLHLLGLFP